MIHHIGIYVTDLERSVNFYETILTIHSREKLKWNDDELLFLQGEGFQLELIPALSQKANTTHIAFAVNDIEGKIEKLQIAGLSPSEGPFHLENGWKTVFYEGPDGEEIEFMESKN
jgi:catechol 2,3-dioxygenase-like lactoylglutathione lyase family enzyme